MGRLAARLRSLTVDARGGMSLEFVVTLPILLMVLMIATEYGRALQIRSALDLAVADGARYLSRVPLETDGSVPTAATTIVDTLIQTRMAGHAVTVGAPTITDATSLTTTAEYLVIGLSADVDIELYFLGFLARQTAGATSDDPGQLETSFYTASPTIRMSVAHAFRHMGS